ncbi:hypothetical protein [Nocardioides sp. B-3]|uniref:hypothetical protein n=1 Tax=Nocardioides sp. B-3 TaxID=2895565 RepID=UPI0021527697|nr:hypothetical protein [Nocardioides sp. B-3]UUZ59692.1 hypothetical protein LP418_00665 [Nocardioides sp. B-3]
MFNSTDSDFDEFAVAAWPRLRRSAYLLTGDHHLAEDLAQTALARTCTPAGGASAVPTRSPMPAGPRSTSTSTGSGGDGSPRSATGRSR